MRSRQLVSLCIALLLASYVSADTIVGRVVGVTDGDTITILDGDQGPHKIRIAWIDAPERGQAFAEQAKQHLAYLVYKQVVTVEYSKRDRYGRIVGKVTTPRKVIFTDESDELPVGPTLHTFDAGLELIKLGLAWHFKRYADEQSPADRHQYANAEADAQRVKLGLWRDEKRVPPWEWRRAASVK